MILGPNSNSGYDVVHVWSEHGGGAACGYAAAKVLINSRAILAGVYLEQPFPVCCTCIDIVKRRFACAHPQEVISSVREDRSAC